MRLLFLTLVLLTVLSSAVLSLMSEEALLKRTNGRKLKAFDRESKIQPTKLHGSARPNGKMATNLAVPGLNDGSVNGQRTPFNRRVANGVNRRKNPLLEHKRNIAQSKFAALEAIRQQKQRQFEAQQFQLFQQQQQQRQTIQPSVSVATIQPKN